MKERVQKILSNAGYCSRRKAEELIAEGKVTVNARTIKLGDRADKNRDKIMVEGIVLQSDNKVYYKFYKPKNVITSLKDPGTYKTIVDFISGIRERVYPVGRLDLDAEGLIILTNDGEFANRIMHPRYELNKIYQADLRDRIKDKDLNRLKGKLRLKDGTIEIKYARLISRNQNRIEISIHEGRNKIVKRIFKELGFYVKRLKRVGLGNIRLGNLKPGRIKRLTKDEILSLYNKKIMVFGTFDLIHEGHLNFFEQARKYGSHLTVVIARDDTVKKIKGKMPLYNEKNRLEEIKKIPSVDKVLLATKNGRYSHILKEKPDIVCLGHDQKNFTDGLYQLIKEKNLKIKIQRLKPYKRHIYKSSKIKEKLNR